MNYKRIIFILCLSIFLLGERNASAQTVTANAIANVSCNGGSNGSAFAIPSGGSSPYTYSWAPTGGNADTATGLAAGNYTVTLTDNVGNTASAAVNITQPNALSANAIVINNVGCNGYSTGSASANISGGTSPFTYLWSNTSTTDTITGLSAGTYSVTISDSCGASASGTVTVTQPNALSSATATVNSNVSCNGGNNGNASVSVSGGGLPYTYLWTNGATTDTASGLTAGSYSVTVSDSCGTSASATITITQPASALTLSVNETANVICNGNNTGSASSTVSGGTSPYTYLWTNGGVTDTATGLSAGSYTLSVTDSNGCSASAMVTITQPNALSSGAIVLANVTCNGNSTGSASANISGGTSPFTYLWSNTSTTDTISGLSAGSYSVTVSDSCGASASAMVTITQPNVLSSNAIVINNVGCNGNSTGSASANISGGTSPFTYLWSNTSTTDTITGLSAGTYSVTISDSCGASASGTVTITQPNVLSSATATVNSNVSCNGGNNGNASVSVSGGGLPYTYLWTNGTTTDTASGLTAGSYSVTVSDSCGTSASATITITQPASALTLSVNETANVICNGNSTGSASSTVSGGTSPYTYLWTNGGVTDTATGLSAGSYTLSVTDSNGCSASAMVTITQPNALSSGAIVLANITCNGNSTGSASANISGGTSPFTYLWSNTSTTDTISGLSAGSYSVTVSDSCGASASAMVTITQPNVLSSSAIVINNAGCNGASNGGASANPVGGTSPFTYLWGGGQTTDTITGLSAGTYSVTISDSCGASASGTVTITQPNVLSSATATVNNNVSCNSGSNGSASVSVIGGGLPYTYLWTNGSTTDTASGLSAGSYSVTVSDSCGASASATITITQPTAITLSANVTANVGCNGASNGSASSAISGGVSPYTYSWTNGSSTDTATGLSAGSYTLSVTDSNGCSASAMVTITQPNVLGSAVATVISNVGCNGGLNGSASVSISGGGLPYTYLWTNGTTTDTASGLSAGSYSVTVSDSCGASASAMVTITQPNVLSSATATVISNVNCNGSNTGSASVSISGGGLPYTYLWTNGTTTDTATGLTAGSYSVTVSDSCGASASATITITQPTAIILSASVTANVLCNGSSTGSASSAISGGVSPYTYLWTNGGVTDTASGLSAGSYTLSVTDSNGCSASAMVTITQPNALSSGAIVLANVTCNGGNNGSASANISGGTSPFTYLWSNSSTTDTISGLSAGSYSVTVSDSCGASVSAMVTITQPNALSSVSANVINNVTCNGGNNGSAAASTVGGGTPFTYLWSNSATTDTASGLSAGTYSVTVTDACGASASATVTITQSNVLTSVTATIITNVSCNGGNNGSASASIVGGGTPFTYVWSNAASKIQASGPFSRKLHCYCD